MTRRVVEKLCTKKICIDFLAPITNFTDGTETVESRKKDTDGTETGIHFLGGPCGFFFTSTHAGKSP